MDIDCIVVFDLREKLEVSALSEIKCAALTIILALHKQSLAHGFTLLKIEESASGIFLEPTNNLEPIQVAIEAILERKILRNIETIDYINEVSKSIGDKVLSLTIFSNGSKELITDAFLKLQSNMEVFFLGPTACNMSSLQAQANKFASGDASYCLDFIDRVNMIDQMQQGNDISHETEKPVNVDIPKKEIEVVQKPESVPQPAVSSSINYTTTKRLDVPRRAKGNGRPPAKKKRSPAATSTQESDTQHVPESQPIEQVKPEPDRPTTPERKPAPNKPLPEIPAPVATVAPPSPQPEKKSSTAPKKPLPEVPTNQIAPQSPRSPKTSPRVEITVISNAVADSATKKQTEPPSPPPRDNTKTEQTNAESPSKAADETHETNTTTTPVPTTEDHVKPEETQPAVTPAKTLELESPSIRPPSRYGVEIPESERIDGSIKQAMWKTYKKTSDDRESADDYSNWSDSSDYSSMEQLKEKDPARTSNSSQKSQASQSSQTSKASQVSQVSQVSQTSEAKSQKSVSAEDLKRVWVKVNTEGVGSSRYTSYQIEVLVNGKSIVGHKRYSEIRTLYDALHFSLKTELGRFPSKTSNKMDTMVIYTRQQYFLKFFTKLLEMNEEGVVKFLQTDSS